MSDGMKNTCRYAGAVLATVAALLLRLLLESLMGGSLPTYITFYPVVMIAALAAGLGPGLTATAATVLLADYFIIPPFGFGIARPVDVVGVAFFSGMGVFMSVVAERLRRSRDRLEETVAERTEALREANEELEASYEELQAQTEELIASSEEVKLADEALRESEKRYRSLFENMMGGFAYCKMLYDDQGRPADFMYLDVNSAFGRLTGLEDVTGKKVTEIIPGIKESNPELFEIYGRVAMTARPEKFETEVKPLRIWFSISVYSPEKGCFVAVFDDITEAKRAEEGLQKAHDELEHRVEERTEELALSIKLLQDEVGERERTEESLQRLNRLYAVLSETDQAIARLDDRDTLFREFCRIAVEEGGFLLSWVGLVDEGTGQVQMIAASGATGYLDDIRVTANQEPAGEGPTGISIREGTYYICNDFQNDPCTRPWHDRGRAYGIQASASVVLKQDGRVIGALTLYSGEKAFFDSTQERLLVQLGDEISFALNSFDQTSRRREAELALQKETLERLRTLEELREKDRMLLQQSRQAAMGEMIGNIAHQWRQPLNVLGLILQELPITCGTDGFTRETLDASVAKGLQVIDHMSRTIDGFRDFFRPDKEMVSFSPFDVAARTAALVDASFRELQIGVEIAGANDIFIKGFPNEYSQVILNILMNARDAFQERSPAGPRTIRVSLTRENERSVLTIADNAGGIPGDILEKIFDPYFTTKDPDQGTGLGLFMSKTIIEKNMNGRLSACNAGEGATFRIEV